MCFRELFQDMVPMLTEQRGCTPAGVCFSRWVLPPHFGDLRSRRLNHLHNSPVHPGKDDDHQHHESDDDDDGDRDDDRDDDGDDDYDDDTRLTTQVRTHPLTIIRVMMMMIVQAPFGEVNPRAW